MLEMRNAYLHCAQVSHNKGPDQNRIDIETLKSDDIREHARQTKIENLVARRRGGYSAPPVITDQSL